MNTVARLTEGQNRRDLLASLYPAGCPQHPPGFKEEVSDPRIFFSCWSAFLWYSLLTHCYVDCFYSFPSIWLCSHNEAWALSLCRRVDQMLPQWAVCTCRFPWRWCSVSESIVVSFNATHTGVMLSWLRVEHWGPAPWLWGKSVGFRMDEARFTSCFYPPWDRGY